MADLPHEPGVQQHNQQQSQGIVLYQSPDISQPIKILSKDAALLPFFHQQGWVKVVVTRTGQSGWVKDEAFAGHSQPVVSKTQRQSDVGHQIFKSELGDSRDMKTYGNKQTLTKKEAIQMYRHLHNHDEKTLQQFSQVRRSMEKKMGDIFDDKA